MNKKLIPRYLASQIALTSVFGCNNPNYVNPGFDLSTKVEGIHFVLSDGKKTEKVKQILPRTTYQPNYEDEVFAPENGTQYLLIPELEAVKGDVGLNQNGLDHLIDIINDSEEMHQIRRGESGMFKGVEIDPNDINWRMVEYTLRVNPELEPTDPKYVKKVITNGMDVAYKINKKSWPNSTEVQNPNGGDVDYAVVIGKTSKGKYLLLIGDLAEKKYIEEYRANNK